MVSKVTEFDTFLDTSECLKLGSDDDRKEFWEMLYFQKYGRFANPGRQYIFEQMSKDRKHDNTKIMMGVEMLEVVFDNMPESEMTEDEKKVYKRLKALKEFAKDPKKYAEQMKEDIFKDCQEATKKSINLIIMKQSNTIIAKEILKATLKDATSAGSRLAVKRAAIITSTQTSSKLAMSRGFTVALQNGCKNPVPTSIAASLGQFVASEGAKLLGIENYHAKNCMEASGSILAGAAFGAVVGGPPGALGGAIAGCANYVVSKSVQGLFNMGWGPNDNWGYMEIDKSITESHILVSTYCDNDTWYVKSYWNEYLKPGSSKVMSAGNKPDQSFQTCIYKPGNTCIFHLKKVYYRDVIHVYQDKGQIKCWHLYGEHHGKESGQWQECKRY